jgi:hypothetical protein
MTGSPRVATQRFQPDGLTAEVVQPVTTESGRDGRP